VAAVAERAHLSEQYLPSLRLLWLVPCERIDFLALFYGAQGSALCMPQRSVCAREWKCLLWPACVEGRACSGERTSSLHADVYKSCVLQM
jgi:hypothetical protein